VASKQMKRYGGIVSFRVRGGEEHALDVCARAEVFTLGESLGGVESLIEHPGRMTHASVAGTDLEVPADLIRLSVGIETIDDLLADLERSLG
jgi:cystathionine gamma-synthase